jgi:hypothetical protein
MMPGFLARLVQRSLAGRSALVPRLAGRYDDERPADTGAGQQPIDALAAPAFGEAASGPAAPDGTGLPAGGQAQPERHGAPGAPHPPADRPGSQQPAVADRGGAPLPAQPAQLGDAGIPDGRPQLERAGGSTVAAPGQAASGRNAPASAQAAPSAQRPVPPAGPRAAADVAGPPAARAGETPGMPARVPAAHTARAADADAAPPAVRAAPAASIPARPPARGALAEPAPRAIASPGAAPHASVAGQVGAVHSVAVTIGRVELRAVTPAAAAAPQPKAGPRPALSLTDYLQRRNQGGDRR